MGRLPFPLWVERKRAAEERHYMILKTHGDVARVGAGIDLEVVRDRITGQYIVQLAGVGLEPVLIPDVDRDPAVLPQVRYVLIDEGQWCIRRPSGEDGLLVGAKRQVEIQRRVVRIGRPCRRGRELGAKPE